MLEIKRIYATSLKSADAAGKYLLKRFALTDLTVKANTGHDVKLDVDVETERLIKAIIKKSFPEHGFMCEESGGERAENDSRWLIDPLDGTVNFFKGIPHFCTSIAFEHRNVVMCGTVYDPVRKELFSALRGKGPFLNGKPINRSGVLRLSEAVVAGGFFKSEALGEGIRTFEKISKKVLKVRFFGSAALDLCYLACGRFNAYVQYSVHEWDIAAASLIANLSGVRIEIEERDGTLNVLAADRGIFDELKARITDSRTSAR